MSADYHRGITAVTQALADHIEELEAEAAQHTKNGDTTKAEQATHTANNIRAFLDGVVGPNWRSWIADSPTGQRTRLLTPSHRTRQR
ncbi:MULTISPECIES: hypothetical protein [Streptomyces rochei group]|uniref:hypothetical protein n=1 Tax=Streptomyces rochei group TaxID=2867164 RepID=UPI0018761C34|nr:hypothetical protein [Streptomyces vinaceusdrappus]